MIEINVDDTVGNAKLALKHRLFVPGWTLNSDLHKAIEKPETSRVIISIDDGVPVGVLYLGTIYKDISVFVKKKYRRSGIGTDLVKTLKKCFPRDVYHTGDGVKWSNEFYNKTLNRNSLVAEI